MNSTTRLMLLALASALVSAGCFSGAYALATANDSENHEIVTREIPWDDSTSLTLGVRSVVKYVQAPGAGKVVARGPHRSVSTLVVGHGDIHDQLLHTGATLEIVVTAPAISRFHLNGASRLSIEGYDQKSLFVSTEGKAAIDAAGRVNDVTIEMKGSGTVNLARLTADTASASIGGMSTLVVAPAMDADLHVRNYASIVLVSRPKVLKSSLIDSGRVVDAAQR
jgi:Putative auto-transporter adhesin, head GIN domain